MTGPVGIAEGGQRLWDGILGDYSALDAGQLATLEQACRQRDRADALAEKAAEGDAGALRQERDSGLAMTRLLAALRLPDQAGKRPLARQLRGVQKPSAVSSLQRARDAQSS